MPPFRLPGILAPGRRPWLGLACLAILATAPARSAFPGANGKIAFARVTPTGWGEQRLDIFTVYPDGPQGPHGEFLLVAAPRRQSGALGLASSPAYSPNGAKIAYVGLGPETAGLEVYLASSSGEERVRLTSTPLDPATPGGAIAPAWSPDGNAIAYIAGPMGGPDQGRTLRIRSLDRDEAVVTGVGSDRIGWSPDGTQIAYSGGGELWSYHLQDHRIEPLTKPDPHVPHRIRHEPAWSPAGDRIAFCQRSSPDSPCSLWWMRPDGTGLEQLTHNAWSDEGPEWSPDGTWLAFASDRPGHFELYLRRAIPDSLPGPFGMEEVRITHSPAGGESFYPSWRPLVEGASSWSRPGGAARNPLPSALPEEKPVQAKP